MFITKLFMEKVLRISRNCILVSDKLGLPSYYRSQELAQYIIMPNMSSLQHGWPQLHSVTLSQSLEIRLSIILMQKLTKEPCGDSQKGARKIEYYFYY